MDERTGTSPGRGAAALELLLVLGVLEAVRVAWRWYGLGHGGGAVATVAAIVIATALLWRRRSGWSALGLRRPARVGHAATLAAGLLVVGLVVVPALAALLMAPLGLAGIEGQVFAHMRANAGSYLFMLLPLGWGSAAFGEEMLYRGFLATRIEIMFGGGRAAIVAAALLQAILFGAVHAFLGGAGMIKAGLLGLAWSAAYYRFGRNLWPLIIAHGLVDTVGLTALYFGVAHAA